MKLPSRPIAISVAVACLVTGLLGTTNAYAAPAPAWALIAGSGPTNLPPTQSEVQRVAVDAEGGGFTLTFDNDTTDAIPADTTTTIPFNAGFAAVRNRLDDLSTIGGVGGSVTVTGGPGDQGATKPYAVAFGGSLADIDVPQMSADSGALTGGINHTASVSTVVGGGPGTAEIAIYAQNIGGDPGAGEMTLTFTLPPGVTTTETPFSGPPPFDKDWTCGLEGTDGPGQSTGKCTSNEWADPDDPGETSSMPVQPGFTTAPVKVPVTAATGAAGGTVHIELSGGGATETTSYEMPLVVSTASAPPGLQAFAAAAYKDNGAIDTRAGAHPYSASASVLVNTRRSARTGQLVPVGEFRDIVVDTPPGFFGNPLATPQCPESLAQEDCEPSSIVATAQVPLQAFTGGEAQELSSVNNIEAPFGYPGKFRFRTGLNEVTVNVVAGLRSDEDYGLEVGSYDTPQIKPVFGSFFTFWGTPFSAGHDGQRCEEWLQGRVVDSAEKCVTRDELVAAGHEDVAFLSNPLDCAEERLRPPVATINISTWQNPGLAFNKEVPLERVEECENLDFEADFAFEPTDTRAADSPAAFRTELRVPTGGLIEPEGLMNPTIRESVVELPKGVVLNASAADGLSACSKEQIGLLGTDFPRPNEIRFTKDSDTCPDASKIGTGELKSELIEEPLQADLFLAEQGEGNPFGSLFAIYLVIEDPRHGIFIKLPGEVQVNQADGQQRVVFRDLPPLPFTYLKLNLKGGSRSPLASPMTCGDYPTQATNTPWSHPESGDPTVSPSSFAIDRGPNGRPCAATLAARPFDLDLNASSDSTAAGAFSPLSIQVTRPDGAQEIDTLEFTLPPGLAASLKGIPYCSEAALTAAASSTGRQEQANPACPAASQIGRTLAGAGSGPAPFYSPGKLYFAGPYKGAPLSVVAITPAVAGPFDLGNVLVRSAAFVDRSSAQVIAKTDPIPQILEGVPLRVRDIRVILDRPGFSLNPTDCDVKEIRARATGNSGAVTNLSESFQATGCQNLGFKPRISLSLKGGTKRGDNPALRAVVRPRSGDANIARAAVTLPRSAFLDQAHIRTICTRVQFAADNCPQAAIYGYAEAVTPLLDEPLKGPVYLRSSSNELPDLVADLRGPTHQPIRIEAAFRTDSIRGGLRSTIDASPDAPVTKFILQMQGGKKGLVVNSQNLCAKTNRATARLLGQNGRRYNFRPKVKALNCKKAKGKKSRRAR